MTESEGVAYALQPDGIAQIDVAKGLLLQLANLTALLSDWSVIASTPFSVSSDNVNMLFVTNGSEYGDGTGRSPARDALVMAGLVSAVTWKYLIAFWFKLLETNLFL